jgi:GNAT superfamily N-acetyltransferase
MGGVGRTQGDDPGRDAGAEPVQWQVANEPTAVRRLARKIQGAAPGEIRSCYEAGVCGYTLQRQLGAAGMACAPYHHRGIGRQLPWRLAERARRVGATGLYVSATPTRDTVDAYRHMGAIVLETPDPALLALEPDDIHLLLPIP